MRGARGCEVLCVSLILVTLAMGLPLAQAADASFQASASSVVVGAPEMALLLNPEGAATSVVVRASEATVRRYEAEYLSTPVAVIRSGMTNTTEFAGRNLTLKVSLQDFGFLAFQDVGGNSAFGFTFTGTGSIETREPATYSSARVFSQADERWEDQNYFRRVEGAHLLSQGPGRLTMNGDLLMKVNGARLDFEAEGEKWSLRTGAVKGSESLAGTIVYRWVYVVAHNVTVEARSEHPWLIASSGLELSMTTPCQGNPLSSSEEQALKVRCASGAPAGAAAGPPRQSWWPLLFLGAVTLGGASASLVVGRHVLGSRGGPADELTPETCAAMMESQVEAENWPRALYWADKASELAPTSALVRATQGFVLAKLGRWDEAIAAYEEASTLAPEDGEHDLNAARTAAVAGKPAGAVAAFLLRALQRAPSLVAEADGDEVLMGPLAENEEVARALVDAWSHFGAGPGGPKEG